MNLDEINVGYDFTQPYPAKQEKTYISRSRRNTPRRTLLAESPNVYPRQPHTPLHTRQRTLTSREIKEREKCVTKKLKTTDIYKKVKDIEEEIKELNDLLFEKTNLEIKLKKSLKEEEYRIIDECREEFSNKTNIRSSFMNTPTPNRKRKTSRINTNNNNNNNSYNNSLENEIPESQEQENQEQEQEHQAQQEQSYNQFNQFNQFEPFEPLINPDTIEWNLEEMGTPPNPKRSHSRKKSKKAKK